MEDRIAKFTTAEQCETFANNAITRGREDLARLAKKRAVQLRAQKYGAHSKAELEALEAIYAYEEVLTVKNGKKTRASRTWPMVKTHGLIKTVEMVVSRADAALGFTALQEMDMLDFAFESVVVRNPDLFSPETLEISKRRLEI